MIRNTLRNTTYERDALRVAPIKELPRSTLWNAQGLYKDWSKEQSKELCNCCFFSKLILQGFQPDQLQFPKTMIGMQLRG